MDPTAIKALSSLYVYGPLGILAVLGFILFFLERKRVTELTDKLSELSNASIKADMEHTKTYEAMERVMEGTMRVLVERK
jgi:hypothetical protein